MLSESLVQKLDGMRSRYAELETLLSTADVASSPGRSRVLSRELGSLTKFVRQYNALRALQARQAETQALLDGDGDDPEFRQLAQEELRALDQQIAQAEEAIKESFATEDQDTARDVIVEIRAGTGGEEAALFAADLFRMYQKYAEKKGWKTELLHAHATDIGGLKEVFFSVEGRDVYKHLCHESGVHRVQRVPTTEASGRRHTSTVTVAVLPAAEEEEIEVRPEDLEWDTFRASGPGGQNVNKVSSAVRLTHAPTGTVVHMQDDRSQHKNRAKALRVLRSILYERKREEEAKTRGDMRRSQVGTGDRSERIRTYNFPENRLAQLELLGVGEAHALEQLLHQVVRLVDELLHCHGRSPFCSACRFARPTRSVVGGASAPRVPCSLRLHEFQQRIADLDEGDGQGVAHGRGREDDVGALHGGLNVVHDVGRVGGGLDGLGQGAALLAADELDLVGVGLGVGDVDLCPFEIGFAGLLLRRRHAEVRERGQTGSS